jgi:hypothetical protein
MPLRQQLISALGLAALVALGAAPALAAPNTASTAAPIISPTRRARASLRVELGRSKAWLGQAIPITVSAQFRDVDGAALEGLPQIKSDSIFTSDLVRDPKQSTQISDGEPVLVATWTGTITPSTAGPLALSVELPVQIRYHDAAPPPRPREADPSDQDEDPFQAMQSMMNIDPSDPNSIQRVFRSMQRSFPMNVDAPLVGRSHNDSMNLKAVSRSLNVQALPLVGQPPTFNGAVGRFDLRASLSAATARVNEPLTLTLTVKGDGDLDRVDPTGVLPSVDWKTYPVTAKAEVSAPGKKPDHKIFEQVLIPMHGGSVTVPALELPVFDPISGRYTAVSSAPLTVAVDGPPAPQTIAIPPTASLSSRSAAQENPAVASLPPPEPNALVDSPKTIALRLAPIVVLLLGAALTRAGWGRDPERSLHRALRRTARQGSVSAFFDAACRLITVHFSKRWGVAESEVTAEKLRVKLGAHAEPLINAISTSEALRFGRRNLEPVELGALCSSIEESLRNAA